MSEGRWLAAGGGRHTIGVSGKPVSSRFPMPTIVYLCSQCTISGSSNRRSDAFEHDNTLDALRPAFAQLDMTIEEVCWDDESADWSSFDGVIIGTTWDYWDRQEKFIATLEQIGSQTLMMNSASTVSWNIHKSYLRDFADKGQKLIPTLWIDNPSPSEIQNAFSYFDCESVVAKRQVGAGADGQFRFSRTDEIPELSHPMMVQPFLPAIQTEGELSFIFIDGQFSHALKKSAKAGDYRIQSSYGGTEAAISPSADDLEQASRVLNAVDDDLLYARVDMLRSETGELYLMELEAIEPYLYPLEGPELGPRMAQAVARRLSSSAK